MQITSKFTIALHIISCIDYFHGKYNVNSTFLSKSIGANPVIIRGVMSDLKQAGIIHSEQGKSDIKLTKKVKDISFYDVYRAVDEKSDESIFNFHDKISPNCPVGRNMHYVLDERLAHIQMVMENEMKKMKVSDVLTDLRAVIESQEETGEKE